MGDLTYFNDSDGRRHFMYRQDERMSCALACLFVIDNYLHLSTNAGGEPRIKNISALFPGSLAASQATDPTGVGDGTSLGNVEQTAAALGVRFTATDSSLGLPFFSYLNFDKARLYDDRPALVGVRWDGGGGHAVVAARFTASGQIVILDPGEPSLHEISSIRGRYRTGRITRVWYTG